MAIVTKQRGRDPRVQWFPECRFGMFIHFGLYALLGRGEWVQLREQIPRPEYERLAERFNPVRFSAEAWVDLATEAGARYITVTAKHHDGFCLFDSGLTDYKITNTPFGRDLIGELVTACHRKGMRICLYYSQPDWHHRHVVHRRGAFKDLQVRLPDQEPDWPRFLEYVEGQVTELVTRYGRIDGIWFDGMDRSEKAWGGRRLYDLVKEHQPDAVVNDRAGYGDFFTPERSLPEDLTGFLFEACESISVRGWGYTAEAPQFSVPHLVESLVRMAAAGGNYLLNAGPMPDGTVPPAQAERMRAIGWWLKRNGEAVYGTEAGRLRTGSPDVLATRKGRTVYLHLLRWPTSDHLLVPGIRGEPSEAALPAGERPVAWHLGKEGLELRGLPPAPPDALVTVLRLRFGDEPALRPRRTPRGAAAIVDLKPRGVTRLSAEDAAFRGRRVKGSRLRTRPVPGTNSRTCITNWGAPDQRAEWKVRSDRPRTVRVRTVMACPEPYDGSTFAVKAGRERLEGTVEPTDSFDDFRRRTLGTIALPKGVSTVRLEARDLAYGYLFADVQGLELRPA